MQFIPLMPYVFRWPIEVSCYEQKTFWSLRSYMVRSRKGIEMLINLINISYCAMKLLQYQDEAFSKYRAESVQEFRFALSEQIRQQVFYAIFVEKVETSIKSNVIIDILKQLSTIKVVKSCYFIDVNLFSDVRSFLSCVAHW